MERLGKWTPFCYGAYAQNLNETYWPITLKKSTNEIVEVYGDEGPFKRGISFMDYAYRMGVLDPDSFTQGYGDVINKLSSARAIATVMAGGSGTKYLEDLGYTGKGYTSTNSPVVIQGDENPFRYVTPVGRAPYFCIGAHCENPELVMQYLNLMYDPEFYEMTWNGLEGEHYTVDENGNRSYTEAYYEQYAAEKDLPSAEKFGWGAFGSMSFMKSAVNPATGKPFSISYEDPNYYARSANSVTKDMFEYYGVSTPDELYAKLYESIPDDISNVAWNAFNATALPDDLKLMDTNINSYLDKQYIKLTMCETEEAFEAEWEATKEHLNELGLEQLKEYLLPLLNDALQMQADFYNR